MYLVDTVVLSELRKRKRNLGLVAWFEKTAKRRPVRSVISVGEIERGIARQRLTNPDFSMALATWLCPFTASAFFRSNLKLLDAAVC